MATIRVHDWTKERIEEIKDRESHSSYDSVIKSLLKDRELAAFAETAPDASTASDASTRPDASTAAGRDPDVTTVEAAVEDLTVFAELRRADSGVLFLWCPGCGTEIAHLSVENPITIQVFEVECRNCLAHLDQHALVAIEIGYPLEQRLVDNALEDDLRTCVVDYWDRTLRGWDGDPAPVDGADAERLVWQFDQYVREFNWEWPRDVPVVGVDVGRTYLSETTGDHIEVVERVAGNRNAPDSYRGRRYEPGAPPESGTHETLDPATITELIVDRDLTRVDESTS